MASVNSSGPLRGVKVLDLSHVMAGPTCTLLLADLGADVIKVERPPAGDDSRQMAPPYVQDEAAAYLMMNRNKRGIVLNLKTSEGRSVFKKLVAATDVVVENYRRGALDKLGLSYDAFRSARPDLIWTSISGFGRTGPYADRPGFDLMAQAMSGIMSFTGEGPGRPPVKVGAPLTDISAGVLAALGIVAALNHRNATGRGQRVETSLFEAAIMYTFWQSAMAFATGVPPAPLGSAHPLDGPYQAFATKDAWIVVGAANQANWLRLVDALGQSALAEDERFRDNPSRMRNLAELVARLEPLFGSRTSIEWLTILSDHGVPCAPVLTVTQMQEDPQAIARDMIATVEHSKLGPVKTLGAPIKFSETPASLGRGAPLLGEHTREVLGELGYGEADIGGLEAAGAVVSASGSTGEHA